MEVLPLTVCRWKRNLDLSALRNAQADPYLRFLSWINKDGRLACRKLASNDVLDGRHLLLPKPIQQYMWLPSKNEALLSLVVLDNDCGVVLYSVTVKDEGGFESHKVATISGKVLSDMLKSPRSDDALLHWSLTGSVLTQLGTVLLNVNGTSVAVLTLKGDEFELSHQLDCCGAEGSLAASEIVDTVLMKNLLFVLLDRGTVLLFTLKNGAQLAQIDVHPHQGQPPSSGGEEDRFTQLTVLPALDCLVCTTANYRLHVVKLAQYFAHHDSSICHESMGEVFSKRQKSRSIPKAFSDEDEEDLYILGYRSGKPESLMDSVQQFLGGQLSQFKEAMQQQSVNTTGRYTWEDILTIHCPEMAPPTSHRGADTKLPSGNVTEKGTPRSQGGVFTLSVLKWVSPVASDKKTAILMTRAQGNSLLVYCTNHWAEESPVRSKVIVLAFDGPLSDNMEPSVIRLSRSLLLVPCHASHYYGGLIIRENSATLMTCGVTEQDFINKVLMYDDAVAAEGVCRLNRWEKRTLPLNALKMALELKQMDTLAFFLRPITARDEIEQDEGRFTVSPRSSVPLLPGQLEGAMDLIISRLHKCFSQSQHILFAKQLLHLALEFLVNLIEVSTKEEDVSLVSEEEEIMETDTLPARRRHLVTSDTSEGSIQEHVVETVSMDMIAVYMKELWSFLSKNPTREEIMQGSTTPEESSTFPTKWSSMTIREIVQDSLLQGCLPLAQSYVLKNSSSLEYHTGDDTEEATTPTVTTPKTPLLPLQSLEDAIDMDYTPSSPAATHPPVVTTVMPPMSFTHEAILATGMGLVVESLHRENVELARELIVNMGFGVKDTLSYICFHTLNTKLREFLISTLDAHSWLSDKEKDAIEYLHLLEQSYQTRCYNSAVDARRDDRENRKFFLPITIPGEERASLDTKFPTLGNPEVLYPEYFGGNCSVYVGSSGHQLPVSTPVLYAQVPLQAVLQWSAVTREKVMLEACFLHHSPRDSEDSLQLSSFGMDSKQEYYVAHNDLVNWKKEILSSYPGVEERGSVPGFDLQNIKNVTEYASEHVREVILIELGKRNIFIDAEMSDFTKLLFRLAATHGLFCKDHPLIAAVPSTSSDHSHNVQTSPVVTQSEAVLPFHKNFIKYCVSNEFSNLLYYYLDHYQLALNTDSINKLGLSDAQPSWVNVLIQCRLAAERLNDPSVIFSSSLACGRLLLGRSDKPLEQMIKKGRTLMALATLMYSGISLADATAVTSVNEVWHVEEQVLKEALAPHPKLKAAIFPPPAKQGSPAETQDISLYQLLQGNTPFNVQHLFGWQSTNTLFKAGRRNTLQELPHFSSPELVVNFSQEERLSYLFFLRQGLPSFAYANFIVGKKVTKKNFAKKANATLRKVYSLALLHIYEDRVTSACAAFIEMLGLDSGFLRVDLEAARRIIEFSDGVNYELNEGGSLSDEMKLIKEEKRQSTVSLFLKMNGSMDSTLVEYSVQEEILKELESVTISMKRNRSSGTTQCNHKTEEAWDLPQQFCRIHHLPPTQAYLKMCAGQGNWLSFLCHAQRYGFKSNDLIPLVRVHFSDQAVAEHLVLSLTTNLEDRKLEVGKSVHFREKYYQRMGVTKPQTEDSTKEPPPPKPQPTPPEDIDPANVPLDLFGIIFKCKMSDSPWLSMLAHAVAIQEPLLAILAVCEKTPPSLSVDCVCVWLLTTMDKVTCDIAVKFLKGNNLQWRDWTLDDLSLLMAVYVVHCRFSSFNLVLLFEYFDPNNPLKHIMKFYNAFVEQHKYDESRQLLRLFEESIQRNLKKMNIGDLAWVKGVASMVIKHMMVLQSTSYERKVLLNVLFDMKMLQKQVDFRTLGHISDLLSEVGIGPDEAFIATETLSHVTGSSDTQPGSETNFLNLVYQADIRVNSDLIMRKLMEKGEFEVARKCAELTDIRLTDVILQEVHHMVKELADVKLWNNKQERMNLWLKCSTKFERFRVEPSVAVKFFESQLKGSESNTEGGRDEEALLYMLILKWLRNSPTMTPAQLKLKEREIWRVHIRSILQEKDKKKSVLVTPSLLSVCSPKPSALLSAATNTEVEKSDIDLSKMALVNDVPIRPPIPSSLLTDEEQEGLDIILGRLLNMGRIDEARNLADLFDQGSKELSIVLSCIKLAQGQLTPTTMSSELLQGLSVGKPLHRRLSDQVVQGWTSSSERSLAHSVIQMMETLMDHSQHAKDCCRRILICYKISVVLLWSYKSVVEKGPLDLVMSLFACHDSIKYSLAQEFITLCHLPCEVIGDFLGKRIKEALEHHFKVGEAPSESLDLYPKAIMTCDHFTATLAQLCPQHAILGRCLLEHAKAKLDAIDTNINNLLVAVELLIRSHDCFSMTCNTDGIAEVLREAYMFFDALNRHKKFSVMVRLLTGIGRFRDMTYIIDALVTGHHFERLLQKDLEKSEELKLALFEYLSQRHPEDTEMMMMFTLRYQMHREHAAVVEAQATKKLAEIKIKKSDSNTRLKRIWDEYRVAAEFYAKEDCLTAKERCISLARLVAMQLSLLSHNQQVINLERHEVTAFLEKHTSFQQALVVANAYKYSMKIDWVDPLFKHVVVLGDSRYLSDFKKVYPLTSQLLEEMVKRCKKNEGKNSQVLQHMTNLIDTEPMNLVTRRKLLVELKNDKAVPELDGFLHDISCL